MLLNNLTTLTKEVKEGNDARYRRKIGRNAGVISSSR